MTSETCSFCWPAQFCPKFLRVSSPGTDNKQQGPQSKKKKKKNLSCWAHAVLSWYSAKNWVHFNEQHGKGYVQTGSLTLNQLSSYSSNIILTGCGTYYVKTFETIVRQPQPQLGLSNEDALSSDTNRAIQRSLKSVARHATAPKPNNYMWLQNTAEA